MKQKNAYIEFGVKHLTASRGFFPAAQKNTFWELSKIKKEWHFVFFHSLFDSDMKLKYIKF